VKKTDLGLLLLAVAAMVMAVWAFVSGRRMEESLVPQKGAVVIGSIRENDCLDCLEKLLCTWAQFEKQLARDHENIRLILYFASEEGEAFDTSELEPLCPAPAGMQVVPMRAMNSDPLLPSFTPSVALIYNNRVVIQEPVFVTTDMDLYIQEFAQNLASFRAYTPVIPGSL
jgi:hypothetical protein